MAPLLTSLLPFIVGSALVPVQNIINILVIKSPKQGLLKATAYISGMTTLRLLQGLIFGLSFSKEEGGGKSPIVMLVSLIFGLLFFYQGASGLFNL
jgi:hypothetical protein